MDRSTTYRKLMLAVSQWVFSSSQFILTHVFLLLTCFLVTMLGGWKWRFSLYLVLFLAFYLLLRAELVFFSGNFSFVLSFNSILLDKHLLVYTAVSMLLQLSVFALEAWAEKKHISKRMAFLVRSIFLLGLSLSCLILSQSLSYTHVIIFLGGFLFSVQVWSAVGFLLYSCKHWFDTALVRQALYWRNLRWMDIGVPLPYSAPTHPFPRAR